MTSSIIMLAGMEDLVVRPMTRDEFEVIFSRLVREYAADHVRAGNWTEDEAETAAEQTEELLPQGVDTPGMLLLVAETPSGEPIGHVWVGLAPQQLPGSVDLFDRGRTATARQGLRPRTVARRRAGDRAPWRECDRPQRLRSEHGRPQPLRVGRIRGLLPPDAQDVADTGVNDKARGTFQRLGGAGPCSLPATRGGQVQPVAGHRVALLSGHEELVTVAPSLGPQATT